MDKPLTPQGSLFTDILGNLSSDYTTDTEDMCPLVK